MLSIGKVQRGASGKLYYMKLSQEDYYLKQGCGDPPGVWMGRGARELGLSGDVSAADFCRLFDGYSPSGEALTQNHNHANRRPAFDLTFSAPKSFGNIRAVAEPELAARMDEAHRLSALAGIDYLEREATFTRIGAQGAEVVEGHGLTVAAFQHLISRELDPQPHIHCVAFNFTKGPDGQHRTLDGHELYLHKMAAGAAYRAELSHWCEQMGLAVERDRFSFRIVGVSKALEAETSKRSEQIGRAVGDPEASAALRAKATLETREPKSDVDRGQLMGEWRETAARHGLTAESARSLFQGRSRDREPGQELREVMDLAVEKFSQGGASTITPRKLAELAFVEAQCRGLTANDVRLATWGTLEHARRQTPGGRLVYLGQDQGGDEHFTTPKIFDLEKDIIRMAEESRRDRSHRVGEGALARALAAKPTLRPEQRDAVRAITQDDGSVKFVCGWAGTGKTYMLDCAREAWEHAGLQVLGVAVSGKAAQGLGQEAHMKSDSLAKLLWDLEHPGPRAKFGPLDRRTVVCVDEAGMVGTEQFHRLMTHANEAGAKLVCVGDEKQIQAIDAGGGFAGLSRRLGYSELKDVTRQRDEEDRRAVYDFAQGRAAEALENLAKRGRVILGDDKPGAMAALVSDWHKDPAAPESKLILATTNAQAYDLNAMAQDARREAGELGAFSFENGQERIHANDRILFTGAAKRYGIVNGDLATVTVYDPVRNTMGVKLDGGDRVTVPLDEVKGFRLGYSMTTHKSQGETTESGFVFAYGGMTDAQMTYVQTSRARGATRIYSTKDEVGEGLVDLVRAMSLDRKKYMAHDMTDGRGIREGAMGERQTIELKIGM